MKVLYWNVCGQAGNEQIIGNTIDLIADHAIDVACLQEVPYETEAPGEFTPVSSVIAEELGAEPIFEHTRTIYKTTQRLNGYGTAILSLAGIREKRTHQLRDDRFAYMTPKAGNQRVLMTMTTDEAPELAINVAHMSYRLPFGIGSSGRKDELFGVKESIRDQLDNYEVMVGGDFNAQPDAPIDNALGRLGLRNIVDTSVPTFRSRHWYAGHITRNLDRVYVSPILASATVGEPLQSDHNPIIVTV